MCARAAFGPCGLTGTVPATLNLLVLLRDTIMSNLAEKGAANEGKTDSMPLSLSLLDLKTGWSAASSVNSMRMAMAIIVE